MINLQTNFEILMKNIADQIKEAQIKLGYMKETMRFYYTLSSLNGILNTEITDAREMEELLRTMYRNAPGIFRNLQFQVHQDRLTVTVSAEDVETVHKEIKASPFLMDLIAFFGSHHHCTIGEICGLFEKYSKNYCCEKMSMGSDFDYVIFFKEKGIDPYYYCIKMEMGHTIYHRFLTADYRLLIQ